MGFFKLFSSSSEKPSIPATFAQYKIQQAAYNMVKNPMDFDKFCDVYKSEKFKEVFEKRYTFLEMVYTPLTDTKAPLYTFATDSTSGTSRVYMEPRVENAMRYKGNNYMVLAPKSFELFNEFFFYSNCLVSLNKKFAKYKNDFEDELSEHNVFVLLPLDLDYKKMMFFHFKDDVFLDNNDEDINIFNFFFYNYDIMMFFEHLLDINHFSSRLRDYRNYNLPIVSYDEYIAEVSNEDYISALMSNPIDYLKILEETKKDFVEEKYGKKIPKFKR